MATVYSVAMPALLALALCVAAASPAPPAERGQALYRMTLLRAAFEAGYAAGPGPGCERPDLQ